MIVDFLLAIAKGTLTYGDMKTFTQQNNVIKQLIILLIEKHKLELLFYNQIKSIECEELLDKCVIEKFSVKNKEINAKYYEYVSNMKPIFMSLERENIKYAVLKGFSFMDELYRTKDGIARCFADIDILIDRSNATAVKKILDHFGFKQGQVVDGSVVEAKRKDLIYWEINSHQLHEYVKMSSIPEYISKYWIDVDINTTIFEGGKNVPQIETNNLLSQTIPKTTAWGAAFSVLNDTYSLIQLCYHFYKDTIYEAKKRVHDSYSLIKFCDIRRFILHKRQSIDWDELVEVVNLVRINDQIYYPLWLVSSFFGDLDIAPIMERIKGANDYSANDLNWIEILM